MNLDQLLKAAKVAAKAYEAYNASKATSNAESTSTNGVDSTNKVSLQSGTKQTNKDEQISEIISPIFGLLGKLIK